MPAFAPKPGYVFPGQPGGKVISRKRFKRTARRWGLPARAMSQIAKGESNRILNAQQRDPGDGMVGYSSLQFTPNAWGEGSSAMAKWNELGGAEGVRDDLDKQMEMARFLYKAAGNKLTPWYGTRYLTDRTGEGTLGPVLPGAGRRGAGGGETVQPGTPDRVESSRTETFDKAGYEQAQRRAFLGERFGTDRKSILFKSGLLGGSPNPEDFSSSKLTSRIVPGTDSKVLPGTAGPGRGGPAGGQVGEAIKRAQAKLGVTEIGSSNRGTKVDKWSRDIFGGVGVAWCGIFVGTVAKQAGVEGIGSWVASVPAIEAKARAKEGPLEGWVSPDKGRAGDFLVTRQGQHVVFIERVDKNGRLHIIGGNQTGGVSRASYDPSEVYGVARVRYRR